ncbi:MAG: SpoIIE family protein phosphatase [Armatimonadota bacterium]
MIHDTEVSTDAHRLRQMAERQLEAEGSEVPLPIAEVDVRRLVQELQIHQIELEMQNDELQQASEKTAVLLEKYTDLYDFAPVGYFTLDYDTVIHRVNLSGASLLGIDRSHLSGRRFSRCVLAENRAVFDAFVERAFASHTTQMCEVVLETETGTTRSVRIDATVSLDDECHVAVVDISERKKADKILAVASARTAHIADVLQQVLIPPLTQIQPAGYQIAAKYKRALSEAEICGDFYDLIDLDDGRIGIVIGDIVGKGLQAAVRVGAVAHTIRSYAFLDDPASTVMTRVNNAISRDLVSEDNMLTAFFAILDTRDGTLAYTNAGHEPPLIRRSDGSLEYLTVGGAMFTGLSGQVYLEDSVTLQTGDSLVLTTDGITEARNAVDLEQFGPEGIARCLSENVGASAAQIASNLLEEAVSFTHAMLRDDAAIVVIRKLDDVVE